MSRLTIRLGLGLGLVQCLAWGELFSSAAAPAPEPASAVSRYESRTEHDRHGIGKFYMGREIAGVMGHQGADWLERPEREEEEHTSKLIVQLKVKPDEVVADI